MTNHHVAAAVAAALVLAGLAQSAAAATYDGKQPFICAPVQIMSCVPAGTCERETAESINVPQFLKFDVARKEITGTRPNGEALTTAIENVRESEAALQLQGVEGPIMWSIMIGNDGDMLLTAGGNRTAFIAFGACTRS